MIPYHQRAKYLISQFQEIHIGHIRRSENDKADALANLAASLTLPEQRDVQITVGERRLLSPALERIEEENDVNAINVFEVKEEQDWQQPIINYIQHGRLPSDSRQRVDIRRRALRFAYLNDTFYRRSFDGILLRCDSASLAISEPNIEEEEAKVPTASSQSKTMSCRKTAKHKTRLKSNGVVSH